MNQLFDTRPDRPGYRLQLLEIFNWGTFDSSNHKVFQFRPEGRTSLLVGHNGSGKSTLVDAVTTLLGCNRSYNLAAGAKSRERTTKTYIKGAYDQAADESNKSVSMFLRPKGDKLTALSAQFTDERLSKTFTLLQVLYLRNGDSDDRVYAIFDGSCELSSSLNGLNKSDEIRKHLKSLGFQTTKKPTEYLGWIAKRTKMRSKAIDMFNQTVAVKNIDSLTKFVRDHMLEATNWREKVQSLLTHFNDLSQAHQQLERARKQIDLLKPVRSTGKEYQQKVATLRDLELRLEAADLFFADQFVSIFEPELESQRAKVAQMTEEIKQLKQRMEQLSDTVRQLQNEIDQAGGDRLKQLPQLIENEKLRLQSATEKRLTFERLLSKCKLDTEIKSAPSLEQCQNELKQIHEASAIRVADLSDKQAAAIGEKSRISSELQTEQAELELLQSRRTNLPPKFVAMRSQICGDLKIDESELPFAAELIEVAKDETQWESSIEMVLNSFALSLLTPERYYSRVRSYLETNRIQDDRGHGSRIDYIHVGKALEQSGDRQDPRSLAKKLNFKPRHGLSPWVRGEVVRRFNFTCCNNLNEFNDVPQMALTANRHVKFNNRLHKKDDRRRTVDPRYFVLGWDNAEKRKRVAAHIERLKSELSAVEAKVADVNRLLVLERDISRACEEANLYRSFDLMDTVSRKKNLEQLETEKRELEESNNVVKALRSRLDRAKSEHNSTSKKRDAVIGEQGRLENEIDGWQKNLDTEKAKIELAIKDDTYKQLSIVFEAIRESQGKLSPTMLDFTQRKQAWEISTKKELAGIRKPIETLTEKLLDAQNTFLRRFPDEADDLSASLAATDSFIALLEQLEREDLPQYLKRFEERLNDQVTSEIAQFNTSLRLECQEILEKIDQLNGALADVVYDHARGTFMQLDPRRINDGEIDLFRRSLRECMDESLESTKEANEARFLRIKSLVEKLSDKEKANWRNKVIDVRNWYNFAALELSRVTKETLSVYEGGASKSGGEKAKLAFTILVAAISYQFDIDPTGETPGRFQFVVVDEMFSKVDDQNATFALELFRQFGLQLLIVAPLDAKARITEPFVDRFLHVVKNSDSHKSLLYNMTAREYEEVIKNLPGTKS